jgi:membrane-associated protease RseP (regulator of RpoE activity)
MRSAIIILLTTVAGAAAAAPPAGRPADQSFHVTVTAGQGRLGLGVVQISPELRAHLGAPEDRGVLVDRVQSDSPADRAGVRVGDVVIEVDGDRAGSASDMLSALADRKKGEAIEIVVYRAGHRQVLSATLEADPMPGPRGFGRTFRGNFGDHFEEMREMFRDLPTMPQGGAGRMQRELRDRLIELEKRLEKLERGRTRA